MDRGVGLGSGDGARALGREAINDLLPVVVSEEVGVAGSAAILGMLLAAVIAIARVGRDAARLDVKAICFGAAAVLGLQGLLSAAGNFHLLPVIGLPFPFLSRGFSTNIAYCFLAGVVFGLSAEVAHR